MRRREFIATLGSAAACPLVARGQQPERKDQMRRIAVLLGAVEEHDPELQARIAAFREGLEASGWTEDQNIRVEYRFGGGDAERIRTYVIELVNSNPDIIVANSSAVIAELRRATRSVPIVFAVVNEPVGQGFVASLAHPGGNITGDPGRAQVVLSRRDEIAFALGSPAGLLEWPRGGAVCLRPFLGGFRAGSKVTAKMRKERIRARSDAADAGSRDLAPIIAEIQAMGAKSLREIAEALEDRGIPTARGGKEWTPMAVLRVLKRVQA